MYREHPPPAALAALVECFWTRRLAAPPAEARPGRILPDGCSDIIFDLRDGPADPDSPLGGHAALVVGVMRTALVTAVPGPVDLIGVRFRPGGATPVLGTPADELAGRHVALDRVVPGLEGARDRLACTRPELRPAALAGLVDALRRRGGGAGPHPDPRVAHAAGLIERRGGRVSVEALADAVNLSRRQLERLFAREVGSTPKEACRVARFRGVARRMRRDPSLPLARLAHGSGYFDQAHLTREFRRLAGVTPGEYRRGRDVASVQDADDAGR